MTDRWHPDQDLLLGAALGEVDILERRRVAAHLRTCIPCATAQAEVTEGIDLTLPATPRASPPTGFEDRVLGALREAQVRTEAPTGDRRAHRTGDSPRGTAAPRAPRWRVLPVAAAALAGVVLGVAGTQALTPDPPPDIPAAVQPGSVPLIAANGDDVGAVTRARSPDGPQLVVSLHGAPPWAGVTCRLVLRDGTVRDAARWEPGSYGGNTWVLDEPAAGVRAVELAGDSGEVWATADM